MCASHQRHLSLRPLSHCGAIASVTSATSPGADHDKPRHRVVRRSTARFSMARPRLGRCTDRCGRRAWHSDAEHGEQTKTNPSAVTVRLDRVCSRTTRRLANHALRLRMLRRQKPLDDFAHACFYFCAQGTCLAPIHWTSGADRRRVARCGFMSSFGSLYCRSLTWCLALLISRQSLMCGGPRRSRVFSRNERAMQNQRGRCGI